MKNLIVAIVALAASVVCAGQRYDWTGENDTGLWNDADNWSPKAVPTEADDVYIAGGADAESAVEIDIVKDDVAAKNPAARCWSLHLSGYVTFNNSGAGYLDVTGVDSTQTHKEIHSDKNGVYVFNCPLYLSNAKGSTEILTWHGKIYLNGGFHNHWSTYFFYGGGYDPSGVYTAGELHVNGGLEPLQSGGYSAVSLVLGCNYGALHIDKGNNWFYRLQLNSRYGETHVNCDNPWQKKSSDYEYTHFGAGAKLYLHGHDVTFPKHTYMGNDTDVGYKFVAEINTDADKPATLSIQQLNTTIFRTNSSVNITGPLTVKMTEDSLGTQPLNRQIDTTGAILIEGGVWDLCANAKFPNISHLRISKNGKVRLASGVAYDVPKLFLGEDGFQVEGGTYGAPGNPSVDFTSEYLEGDGMLVVADTEADTFAATWNGLGADNSVRTMENWVGAPASLPFSNGGLLPTFAVNGAMAQVADAVRFKGIVFDSAADFTLFGAGLVKLGSLGIETKVPVSGSREYTLNVPVRLNYDQTWNLAAGTTVTVVKVVSGPANVSVAGEGAVALTADNDFTGSLSVNGGAVSASAEYAFGRGLAGNYKAATVFVNQKTATLTVVDATIEKNLEEQGQGNAEVVRLRFDGTNTLKGDYAVSSGTADYPYLGPDAVLNVEGDFVQKNGANAYFAPGSVDTTRKGTINAYGAVNFSSFSCSSCIFHFWADSNANGRLEVSRGGELHLHKPMQFTNLTSSYMNIGGSGGLINFHGNDQKYGRLILALVPASIPGVITSGDEGPATLYFNQYVEDARVNNYGDVAGRLSLVMGGGYGFYNNKALSTAGDLTVTNGTWNFLANGSWLNGTNFTASGVSDACKGRITVAQSKTFGKHAIVHLDGKGVLELGDGVSQRVRELWINGVEMPSGTYGSSQSAAQHKDDVHFAGTGVLRATGGGMMLILR